MRRITLAMGSALLGFPALVSGATNIGTIVADGKFNVNQMQVPGSATLFEGALVESLKASVTIQLTTGPRIDLAAGSTGKVYRDHMVLQTGSARAKVGSGYRIQTASLVLQSRNDATTALIRVASRGATVSVPHGQMEVLNPEGELLARLDEGLEADYGQQGQEGVSQPGRVQLTGKLQSSNGHYLLTDNGTHIIWELVGKVPSSDVGKTVTVVGSVIDEKPFSPAEKVARIDQAKKAVGGFPCFGGGGAPGSERIQLTGPMEKKDGHTLITDQVSKVVSELVGKVPEGSNGTVITVRGTLDKNGKPYSPAVQVIDVDRSKLGGGTMLTGCQKALIAGVAISAAGIGAGFALTQDSGTPVSQ